MSEFFIKESDVWAALQLDLYANDDSPPLMEPVDRPYIALLIEMAQERLDNLLSVKLADYEDDIPAALKIAIITDVAVHYFDRLTPSLPDEYWNAILPYRAWTIEADV